MMKHKLVGFIAGGLCLFFSITNLNYMADLYSKPVFDLLGDIHFYGMFLSGILFVFSAITKQVKWRMLQPVLFLINAIITAFTPETQGAVLFSIVLFLFTFLLAIRYQFYFKWILRKLIFSILIVTAYEILLIKIYTAANLYEIQSYVLFLLGLIGVVYALFYEKVNAWIQADNFRTKNRPLKVNEKPEIIREELKKQSFDPRVIRLAIYTEECDDRMKESAQNLIDLVDPKSDGKSA